MPEIKVKIRNKYQEAYFSMLKNSDTPDIFFTLNNKSVTLETSDLEAIKDCIINFLNLTKIENQ